MLQIGDKYYKYDNNDNLDIIRIHSIKGDNIRISRGISKKRVDKSYLDDYTKLKPDGYVFFNIVNMGPNEEAGKDVVIVLHRRSDLDNNNSMPYAACRQNIYDVYSNAVNTSNTTFIGMSMSIDTVPEGSEYTDILACYGVEYSEKISVYIDDNIDIILSMVSDTSRYNKVLYHIYNTLKEDPTTIGICKSLEELVKDNNFEYDFMKSYGIEQLDFVVKLVDEYEIIPEQRYILEDILKTEIFRTYVVPYSKEIDLKKIERDYLLISDKIGKLYIFAYDKGKYINRYYRDIVKDKRDAVAMIKNMKRNIK